jgi:hypothetical protein
MWNRLALGATLAAIWIGAHADVVRSGSMATTDTVGIARFEAETAGTAAGHPNLAGDDKIVTPSSSDPSDPPPDPVPEPHTWALLGAGLGLLGIMARRRTRR